VVLATRPESEYVVPVEPVLETIGNQVVPLSSDLSILYPVTGELPLFDGAVQDKLICDDDTVLAVRPVGGGGTETRALCVVADAVFDGELVPAELIADTL
jgi:hypothetical protein